MTTVTAQAL